MLHSLFWRCKKSRSWVRLPKKSVHARVRKRFRKKCKKTRSGVPPEQRTPRQDQKMKKCVTYKSKNPGDSTHRKWHHERDPERPAPTRQPQKCFVKKTCFFEKNVIFPKYNDFWPPAPNLGASLRRQNWPCPEYPLLFYKISSKKHPTLGATRFPLSDR